MSIIMYWIFSSTLNTFLLVFIEELFNISRVVLLSFSQRWDSWMIFMVGLVLLMWTSWSRGLATHTQRHQFPKRPSKSGLIGVWHKNILYLGTSTIENEDPHPMNIDSRMRSIRMTPQKELFFDKSFFSSLENHGREIISPTHTQSAANKFFLLIWIV
jgi:hypothetical protein